MTLPDDGQDPILNWLDSKTDSRDDTTHETEGATHESNAIRKSGSSSHIDDVFGRFDEAYFNALRKKFPSEVAPAADIKKALASINLLGRAGYIKLKETRAPASLAPAERLALETVVKADGTRPSFLMRNADVPIDHPMVGQGKNPIQATSRNIRRVAPAIGRIQPTNGAANDFFGTGSLVDAQKGLVLTNFHVQKIFREDTRTRWTFNANDAQRINVHDGVVIDFNGEIDQRTKKLFRIVEVILPKGSGCKIGEIDAAVLRIEPLTPQSDTPLPRPVKLRQEANAADGAIGSVCLIGFPGPPERTYGKVNDVDWDWVTRVLFANRFGLKRLAPGKVNLSTSKLPPPHADGVFGHDASTLGGSSGSLILSWQDDGAPGIALHFAGSDILKTNLCVGFHAIADVLNAAGVPI